MALVITRDALALCPPPHTVTNLGVLTSRLLKRGEADLTNPGFPGAYTDLAQSGLEFRLVVVVVLLVLVYYIIYLTYHII